MRVHRAHPCGVLGGVEQSRVAPRRNIAAVHRGAPAPTAASGQRAVLLHHEIGAVFDQLAIEPHDRPAGGDFRLVQERLEQRADRQLHERVQRVKLFEASGANFKSLVGHGWQSPLPAKIAR
jgi:hypothetical protein